jgi:putative two-component system response regulator
MIIDQLINQGNIRDAKIVLVDDHEDGVALLEQILRKAGYSHVFATTDSRETVGMCDELKPDLLILDLNMPPPSGYDILDQLALGPGKEKRMPILVLTADITPMAKLKALSLGARDFLTKPVEQVDLLLRVRNILETRLAFLQLERGPVSKPEDANTGSEVLERIFATIECLDPSQAERAIRVSKSVALLAAAVGLSTAEAARMESAARVYDVGMLAVPEGIRRNGNLDISERKILRTHVSAAARILGESASMKLPLEIATSHHERWDGNGYPSGARGNAIPLSARIVAVAEALDLLVNPENGKRAMTMEEAVLEVSRQSQFAFDPEVAAALERTAIQPAACPGQFARQI